MSALKIGGMSLDMANVVRMWETVIREHPARMSKMREFGVTLKLTTPEARKMKMMYETDTFFCAPPPTPKIQIHARFEQPKYEFVVDAWWASRSLGPDKRQITYTFEYFAEHMV